MKKPINNNRYRHNNGGGYNNSNQIYSLNYKFDSNSIAGKCSGTALDLIKRYNELARDAQNNNDVVNAEIFRQYAEHYRKIVTDINDKKNIRTNNFKREDNQNEVVDGNMSEDSSQEAGADNIAQEQENMPKEKPSEVSHEHRRKVMPPRKREFTIVEVKESSSEVKNAKSKDSEPKTEDGVASEDKTDKKPRASRNIRTPRVPKITKKTEEETISAV